MAQLAPYGSLEAETLVGGAPTRELVGALGRRALVAFADVDGELSAIALTDRTATRHPIGPTALVVREANAAGLALRTLAGGVGPPAALHAGAERALARLDDLLLGPVRERLERRDLVVIAPPDLYLVPWGGLETNRRRPVCVAPTVQDWLTAQARVAALAPGGPDFLVAGPSLPQALDEIGAVSDVWPEAAAVGPRRVIGAVTTAGLSVARRAHLACHVRFEAGASPALELADGPLAVDRLGRTPPVVVLSATEAGLSPGRGGEELAELAQAFAARGTGSLVLSIAPVPPYAVQRILLAFHDATALGLDAATALAAAAATMDPTDPAERVAAAGFVCLGAG